MYPVGNLAARPRACRPRAEAHHATKHKKCKQTRRPSYQKTPSFFFHSFPPFLRHRHIVAKKKRRGKAKKLAKKEIPAKENYFFSQAIRGNSKKEVFSLEKKEDFSKVPRAYLTSCLFFSILIKKDKGERL
jgi:hypothetical protein